MAAADPVKPCSTSTGGPEPQTSTAMLTPAAATLLVVVTVIGSRPLR